MTEFCHSVFSGPFCSPKFFPNNFPSVGGQGVGEEGDVFQGGGVNHEALFARLYHQGKILERDKFDVDKFGSPTSYQIFPSILRMRCVKGRQPSRGHQEITAATHYEATARDLIPNFSFIFKDQFQIPPPLILALPKKTPPQIIPPVVISGCPHDWSVKHVQKMCDVCGHRASEPFLESTAVVIQR